MEANSKRRIRRVEKVEPVSSEKNWRIVRIPKNGNLSNGLDYWPYQKRANEQLEKEEKEKEEKQKEIREKQSKGQSVQELFRMQHKYNNPIINQQSQKDENYSANEAENKNNEEKEQDEK